MSDRYRKSEQLLERALRTIPLGSQTFSKSKTQFPHGVSPYFIERGRGSRVWDADGHEYIDFVNALASVTLGYCDPDVDEAVRRQMHNGVTFSLPHRLEMEVAERLVDAVPCAEMVRFGKNGSDATAGAIRLARAFTGRDHVAVCGYHGWQDWYIGTTSRDLGVPGSTKALTHRFVYNDLESLQVLFERLPGRIAAVILEPVNVVEPAEGFLQGVVDLAHEHGAVCIFDEMVTGFRLARGGAQERYGVTPDLATFGKGVANGFPLSVVAGRREVMQLMEEIFFSFTFGGETLSLAAAKAVLDKLRREPVIETIHARGKAIMAGLERAIVRHSLSDWLSVGGSAPWSFLLVQDHERYTAWEIKTFLLQEWFAHGILAIGSHNLSYAHSEADVAWLLKVYDEILPRLAEHLHQGTLLESMRCEPLQPLFKVR